MAQERVFAGVELGGTKSIAVLAREGEIIEQVTLPTLGPDETLGALSHQLRDWARNHSASALGIASFGPIRLEASAPEYGRMHVRGSSPDSTTRRRSVGSPPSSSVGATPATSSARR